MSFFCKREDSSSHPTFEGSESVSMQFNVGLVLPNIRVQCKGSSKCDVIPTTTTQPPPHKGPVFTVACSYWCFEFPWSSPTKALPWCFGLLSAVCPGFFQGAEGKTILGLVFCVVLFGSKERKIRAVHLVRIHKAPQLENCLG